jgi:hypothetical protein
MANYRRGGWRSRVPREWCVKIHISLFQPFLRKEIIMQVTPAQVKKALTGNYTFTQFGFSMMLTRLKTTYERDQSQSNLQHCVDEINAFLTKFSKIMATDYNTLIKL